MQPTERATRAIPRALASAASRLAGDAAGAAASASGSLRMTATSPTLPASASAPARAARRTWRRWRPPALFWVLLVLAGLAVAVVHELRNSTLQSRLIADWARTLTHEVGAGPSEAIRFPAAGPYDLRLGYARLPGFAESLWARGFHIESQARFSPALLAAAERGLTPPYREKESAGLVMRAAGGEELFRFADPGFRYARFEDVPELVVRSLLYVENRELLDDARPYANPAVEWDRLARAVLDLGGKRLGASGNVPGGSTLATQIEKYRHSPNGLTADPREKLRQIASATLRAYATGRDTRALRRELAVSYLNTIPLSGTPGWGEVFGLGDGLRAYYGAEPARVNALLAGTPRSAEERAARGLAYRQALSLLLSARRPTGLLRGSGEALEELSAQYLRRMAQEGVISTELRDAALAAPLALAPASRDMDRVAADKGVARLRAWLGQTLDASPYELDRLDLTVDATLDARAQAAVTRKLRELSTPEAVEALGLRQKNALATGDPARVVYAFTLYERTPSGNALRVHADSLGSELDVNDGIMLDLGSTAKLRTLVTYLEVIEELYADFQGMPAWILEAELAGAEDPLTRFALERLVAEPALPLETLLEEALDRRYSASPWEGFFTGGGVHHFANFEASDDERVLPMREAFRRSVNLPFVRLMRDLVRYETARLARVPASERDAALRRHADREGRAQIAQWMQRWEGRTAAEILDDLVARRAPSTRRVATILRSLNPHGERAWFEAELVRRAPAASALGADERGHLYDAVGPEALSLSDRGWLARVQPLELWLASYLWAHPGATRAAALAASDEARIAAAEWLLKTRNKNAQERRLRELREQDAFARIHARWKRLGYPFPTLVPSYATAIGSSADRPAALAELMGILAADGLRLAERRVESLAFAHATPYETNFAPAESAPARVLSPEVATAVRAALADVVANGTARRVAKTFAAPDGTPIVVRGKTGTGDHRHKTFAPGGAKTGERVLNRSAVFTFVIGERHFGVVTAYVAGPEAAGYRFTSALPLEVLKALAPAIAPLVGAVPPVPTPPAPSTTTAPADALAAR
jgi:membrane peptidoglycan carboxypeptidase